MGRRTGWAAPGSCWWRGTPDVAPLRATARALPHHRGAHKSYHSAVPVTSIKDERSSLLHFLAAQRRSAFAILECLSEADARRSVVPSGWTPLSLVVHLADVERHWFAFVLGGDLAPVQAEAPNTLSAAVIAYRAEIEQSDRLLAGFGLDDPPTNVPTEMPGEIRTVRDVVLHVIEEVARHTGISTLLVSSSTAALVSARVDTRPGHRVLPVAADASWTSSAGGVRQGATWGAAGRACRRHTSSSLGAGRRQLRPNMIISTSRNHRRTPNRGPGGWSAGRVRVTS
jgi:uncharacterized damage-inducible protein DinB